MFDFQSIIQKSKLYNFHSHSPFCDGHAPIEDFVVEAIRQGFVAYGVTPHSPFPYPSSCNMSFSDVPVYLEEMKKLKNKYKDKIEILTSFEVDYVDGFGANDPIFEHLNLDYTISSVHFIPSFTKPSVQVDIDGNYENFKQKMEIHFDNDIKRVVNTFYEQSIKMVEEGNFDIIGHFDKIGHNASCFQEGIENEAWYEKNVENLFDAIMDHHIMIEINTKKFISDNRLFPNVKYFSWLKKVNAPVVFNSDAHFPHLINAGRMEAMKLYDNA